MADPLKVTEQSAPEAPVNEGVADQREKGTSIFPGLLSKDEVMHRYRQSLSNSVNALDKAAEECLQFIKASNIASPEEFVALKPAKNTRLDDLLTLRVRLGMSGLAAVRQYGKEFTGNGRIRRDHVPCGKTMAARCFGILWMIRGGSYIFAGDKFSSRVPGQIGDDTDQVETPIGWITAPRDALLSDFDIIIDIERFDGTTSTAFDGLNRILFRRDMDGWVIIPGTAKAPDAFKVVRLGEISELRVTMVPSPGRGVVDSLPSGIISIDRYKALDLTPFTQELSDTRPVLCREERLQAREIRDQRLKRKREEEDEETRRLDAAGDKGGGGDFAFAAFAGFSLLIAV